MDFYCNILKSLVFIYKLYLKFLVVFVLEIDP